MTDPGDLVMIRCPRSGAAEIWEATAVGPNTIQARRRQHGSTRTTTVSRATVTRVDDAVMFARRALVAGARGGVDGAVVRCDVLATLLAIADDARAGVALSETGR